MRCKAKTMKGDQCQNSSAISGYCVKHYLQKNGDYFESKKEQTIMGQH